MLGSDSQKNALGSSLDVVEEAVHSALYSGAQQPYDGVRQLVNHVTSHAVLPDIKVVDAPKEAEFGSVKWHAQQIGGALGAAVPFLAINAGMRGLGSPLLAAASESTGLRLATSVAIGGTSGALYEGLFHPVSDGGDFWSQRAKNAMVGGVTFATMSGAQEGLASLRGSALNPEYSFLSKSLSSKLIDGGASGVLGGVVNAEASSIADGKGAADWKSVAKTAYGYAFIGSTMGAYNHFTESHQQGSDYFLNKRYGGSWPQDSRLQIRSELLNHLVRSGDAAAPGKLSAYLDFLKPDSLGLKDSPYDVGVWEGKERSELLRKIRQTAESPIGTEAALTASIRTLAEATRSWNGNSLEPVQEYLTQARSKAEAAKNERLRIAQANPFLAAEDPVRLITDKALINSFPTYREALRKEFEADAEVAAAEQHLDTQLDARKEHLQSALDKITARHGLPSIEFDYLKGKNASGEYSNGHGKLAVDRDFMVGDTLKTQSLDLTLHELTHFEQDVLVIRRMADGLGIGKKANPEQLDQLAKAYDVLTGDAPSRGFLQNVLENRAGKPLSSQQIARADELLQSFQFYSREGYSKGDFKEMDQLDKLRSLLRQTTTDDGLTRLRNQLATDATLSSLLLGDQAETSTLANRSMFANFYDQNSAHSFIRSKAVELEPAARQRYTGYIGSKLETDAWSVGLLTQIKARSLGIKAFEWNDMKPDYGLLHSQTTSDVPRPAVLNNVGSIQTFEQWLNSASMDSFSRLVQNMRQKIEIRPFEKKLADLQKQQ